jgi:hypothetical protein
MQSEAKNEPTNLTIDDVRQEWNEDTFRAFLKRRNADLACRRSYVDPFGIVGSYAKCYTTNQYKDIVTGKETALYTKRTLDLKHKIHEEKLEKGILDLEPLMKPLYLFGLLFGVAALVREVGKYHIAKLAVQAAQKKMESKPQ